MHGNDSTASADTFPLILSSGTFSTSSPSFALTWWWKQSSPGGLPACVALLPPYGTPAYSTLPPSENPQRCSCGRWSSPHKEIYFLITAPVTMWAYTAKSDFTDGIKVIDFDRRRLSWTWALKSRELTLPGGKRGEMRQKCGRNVSGIRCLRRTACAVAG